MVGPHLLAPDRRREIAVLEGRFGKAEINNSSLVRDSVARAHIEKLPGEVVYELRLERQLLLLNDLAGVGEARASLSPGANVGESDVLFDITPGPRATAALTPGPPSGVSLHGATAPSGQLATTAKLPRKAQRAQSASRRSGLTRGQSEIRHWPTSES